MSSFFRRKTPEELKAETENLKTKEKEIRCSKWVNKLEILISDNKYNSLYTDEIKTILTDENTTGCTK